MDKLRQFFGKINIDAAPLYDEPMSVHTTMRIGGPSDAWIEPKCEADLVAIVRGARDEGIPVYVAGGGANLLVGDGGIRGIVVGTGRLRGLLVREDRDARRAEGGEAEDSEAGSDKTSAPGARTGYILEAEAGISIDELCVESLARGIAGFADFYGMPGSLGGAILMNARCYDTEIANLAPDVRFLLAGGAVATHRFDPSAWSYKRSPFQPEGPLAGSLILGASFKLGSGDPACIARIMRARRADRENKGHYRLPSAGSVFKNDRGFGSPTGRLLDSLGLRGRRIGGAAVSDWHANIFVNAGGASARDMRALMDLARAEAAERLGLVLEAEIVLAGEF